MHFLQKIIASPVTTISLSKDEHYRGRKNEPKSNSSEGIKDGGRTAGDGPFIDEIAETVEQEVLVDCRGC